ncbi:MAG: endonuclease/exonuclease/phosphatase family protein [Clostridia bacterium]|nr:endonuclease/exonuclease/phosphatase family protein [Clostridia bacterium]
MKKLLSVLLLVCLLLVSCQRHDPVDDGTSETLSTVDESANEEQTEPPEEPKMTINVMSFNIYYLNEMTTAKNKTTYEIDCTIATRGPKLNALLKGEAIDIAGLQEASANWRAWLTENLDDDYAFTGYSTRDTGEGGIVLYRKGKYSVIDSGAFWLVDGAPTEPAKANGSSLDRMCTWVVFKINETGDYFLFMDTHLDTVEEARPWQANVLVGQISKLQEKVERLGVTDCPVILVGDMNSRPKSDPYRIITEKLLDARKISTGDTLDDRYSTSPGLQYYVNSYTVVRDEHVIDHIFVSEKIAVNNYKMIHTAGNYCPYGAHISDHNAIIANISFLEGENG